MRSELGLPQATTSTTTSLGASQGSQSGVGQGTLSGVGQGSQSGVGQGSSTGQLPRELSSPFLSVAGDIGKYLQDATVKIVIPGDANILLPNGKTEYTKTTVKCDKNGGAQTTTKPAVIPKSKPAPPPKSKYDGKDVCLDPASANNLNRPLRPGDSNFAFKPNYNFSHKEPTKEWADSYGWSFMPPQYWSVPQRRPPVCIPDKGTEATVTPIYTTGTPLDALDWNRPMVQKPSQEYKQNDNYYYPGWVAQETYNYPFSGTTAEYYNLNKATTTKEP
jgi:hypothetical protein